MNRPVYFTSSDYLFAGTQMLSGLLNRLENQEAYEKFQAQVSEVSFIQRQFLANLKKMNSVRLARRLEKLTGEITFNPWTDRHEVISKLFSLALTNGELPRMPHNPRSESHALRMVLGMPTLAETQRTSGKLTRDDVMQVLKLRGLGLTYREIGDVVGTSDNMACAIVTGISYTHFTGLSKASKVS